MFTSLVLFVALAFSTGCKSEAVGPHASPHYVRKDLSHPSDSGSVLILLHGYGSNERDLLGLTGMFPETGTVVSFRAPIEVSQRGFCWFPIQGHDSSTTVDTAAYYTSGTLLMNWIDSTLIKEGLEGRKVFVAGFSQGAMMSYELVRRFAHRFQGVIGFSGSAKALQYLSPSSQCGADILMTHGRSDQVLTYASGQEAQMRLEKCGATVEFFTFEGGHQIPKEAIAKARLWLRARW